MKASIHRRVARFGNRFAVVLVLFVSAFVPYGHSRPVFQTPSNWNATVTPSSGPTDYKSTAINNALASVVNGGGGTVFLAAGNYYLDAPILITHATGASVPVHVKLVGAKVVNTITPGTGETVLIWNGPTLDRTKSVIEIVHAQNTTVENLRIQAHSGQRFKHGIFFHRIYNDGAHVAPTALNLYDIAINRGVGNFTVGVRFNDLSDHESQQTTVDANCDMNHVENVIVDGATDDIAGGVNAAGFWVDGSQVQGCYYRNITVNNSGTGFFLMNGQCEVFGGTFSTNILTTAYNNPSGGGDFVFNPGMGAGHVIQDVVSQGSYRFYTNYEPSAPGYGYQGEGDLALAIANCTVKSLHAGNTNGDAIFARGLGGPLAIFNCDFGQTSGLAQKIMQSEWTQGSIMLVSNRFNHSTGVFLSNRVDRVTTGGEIPSISMVNSRGWTGSAYVNLTNQHTDTNNVNYTTVNLSTATPRAINSARPIPASGYVLNLANSFVYNGSTYRLTNGWSDVDNAPIINAAIQKVKQDQPTAGGTVWFPNGIYVVKSTINVQDVQNVRLMGVGGRSGVQDNGQGVVKGSGLVWNGSMAAGSTLLRINRSQNIAIEGFGFTTWDGWGYPGTGANTIDRFIHVSQTGTGGYPTQNIWLQDMACRWLTGNGSFQDIGVCNTFAQVGDGAGTVNCRTVTLSDIGADQCAQQAVLLNGVSSTDVQLIEFCGTSRRVVQVGASGGAFAWFGGGAGNSGENYPDAVALELNGASGPIYMAGLECQDFSPVRAIRSSTASNSNKVYVYGVDFYFNPPADQKIVDFKWTGSGELNMFGCLLGWGLTPTKVCASNGSKINSIANQTGYAAGGTSWNVPAGSSVIQDIGSRSFLFDIGDYPYSRALCKYFKATSPTSGRYTLPLSATRGTSINVAWTSPSTHTTHSGDWIGLYDQEQAGDAARVSWVSLGSVTGTSGTTAGTLAIPSTTNPYGHRVFELRFFKGGNGNGGICVYRAPIKAL